MDAPETVLGDTEMQGAHREAHWPFCRSLAWLPVGFSQPGRPVPSQPNGRGHRLDVTECP